MERDAGALSVVPDLPPAIPGVGKAAVISEDTAILGEGARIPGQAHAR